VQHYSRLKVWARAHAVVLRIYEISARFPVDERYGITQQLRRAAVSVPTNIAEGSKRRSSRDFARFINIAEASLAEASYLLVLASDLGLSPSDPSLLAEMEEISRMLNALYEKSTVDKESTVHSRQSTVEIE